VFSPEYYGTTQHADASPNFLILGGEKKCCEKVAELYQRVKSGHFSITFTDATTAELAKYMENCFLGLKVTFCNEFANIAAGYGVSYPELREIFVKDTRMGSSHTYVYKDKPYYDSHCLNKDIAALTHIGGEHAPLMRFVESLNRQFKIISA
jgi:UDP-glucose 6-dehydrogenase